MRENTSVVVVNLVDVNYMLVGVVLRKLECGGEHWVKVRFRKMELWYGAKNLRETK